MEEKLQNIKCPYCLNETFVSGKDNEINICIYCKKDFMSIKCFHCTRKIYFKAKINLDGINIRCPYKNCLKYFSKSSCGICKNKLYFPGKFPEGSSVVCPLKTCNMKYSKVECPIARCDNNLIFQSRPEEKKSLYEEGHLLECNNHPIPILFQKINCFHCLRRLVWISPNKVVDGQKITCPYEDCAKSFNKLICPNPQCKQSNIFVKGGLEFGSPFKCLYCKEGYHTLFCPFCVRNITFPKNRYIEGAKNLCPYKDCAKNFQLISCLYCKRPNIWINGQYIHGQKIQCAYLDCQKIFSKMPCPSCSKVNIFPKANFSFGTTYDCIYQPCKKQFTIFICIDCKTFQTMSSSYSNNDQGIQCNNPKCMGKYFNISCPHCLNTIVGKGKPPFGLTVLCPYPSCSMVFNWLYCLKCHKVLYDKDNNYHDGTVINCKYKDCGISFTSYRCVHCQKNNSYQIVNDIIPSIDKEMKCNRQSCQLMFKPNTKQNVFKNGMIIAVVPSKSFFFVNPVKDANEVAVIENKIDSDEVYSIMESQMKNEENDNEEQVQSTKKVNEQYNSPQMECISCMDNPRESVFVPCGHRCVCYKCGDNILKKYKKCPICNDNCFYLLKKVWD